MTKNMKKKFIYGILIAILGLGNIACSNSDEYIPNTSGEVEKVIYSELFSDSIKAFSAVSVTGDQTWVYDSRGYAYMTGFINPTNFANEDWLISPEINLTDVTTAHFSFDHVARYFADIANEATVWISENYTSGLPSTATWTQITTNPFVDPGSWTFGNSGQISLTRFAGKKVHIAFKFISTATKAGSWEIKNFTVSSGEATIVKYNYGKGTDEEPYTVLGASVNQSNKLAWVKGYIVGYAWFANNANTFYFTSDTCTQKTNLLIADSLGGFYLSQCAAVQLPTGAVRTGINIGDNRSLIGKKVTIYGNLTAYFGMTGVKNTSFYKLEDGTSGGTKPVYPIFSETFISRQGDFTIDNKVLPAGFTSVWNASSFGITASGFKGTNFASESWLISPAINLTGSTSMGMSFEHTINKGLLANLKTDHTLFISTDNGANWTQLTIPAFPAGNNWTFVNSGDIDLNPYIGQTIKIAFKYISSVPSSASWEVKNFQIYKR